MSFRERTLWVALLGNVLVWGGYFVWLANRVARGGLEAIPHPTFLIGVVVWLIIYSILAAGLVQVLARREAQAIDRTLDEREQVIAWRAGATAYTLLSVFTLLIIGGLFTGWPSRVAINALLLAFVLAESLRYTLELRALRA
ncbi:MAG: hypothetical protein ACK4MX_07085 [Thermaurantiacus sp.]